MRSHEATRLAPVLVARTMFALPYMWSRMELRHDGDEITYTTRRRWPNSTGRPASRLRVRIGEPVASPTPLEDFLTARWGLHVDWHGRTLYLPNAHPAWPLHRAEVQDLDDDLVRAAGLSSVTGLPANVLYSPGVPVRFGRPI